MKTNNEQKLLAILEPYLEEDYESELKDIFEELEKNDDIGAAIDAILEQTDDLLEIQAKTVLLIKQHLKLRAKEKKKKQDITKDEKELEIIEEEINKDITELARRLLKQLDQDLDIAILSKKDRAFILDKKAKKDFKRIIEGFAVYEIYKVMNPRRIAGETKKQNFKNNLFVGGKGLAMKYEGGKKADLAKYSTKELTLMQKQAKDFRKNGGEKGWSK